MQRLAVIKISSWADTCLVNLIPTAVKERYPECRVTLVTGRSLTDWTGCLHFDDVIYVDDDALFRGGRFKRGLENRRLSKALRTGGFDTVFNLHVQPKLQKISHGRTRLIQLEARQGRNDLDAVLSALEKIDVKPQKLNFKLRVRQHVYDETMKKLAALELRSKGYIAVAPGGGENVERRFHHKRWTFYPELLKLICENSKLPVVLLGAATDAAAGPPLTFVDSNRIISLIGKLTREESLAVIGEAAGFIGNDTGLSHIAGAVGTPAVVLFGPTSSKRRYPAGQGKTLKCIDAQVPCSPCAGPDESFRWDCRDNVCMKSISPKQVWEALQAFINP